MMLYQLLVLPIFEYGVYKMMMVRKLPWRFGYKNYETIDCATIMLDTTRCRSHS
jgi:hypothetical protein